MTVLWISNPKIWVKIESQFLPHSAWERDKTIKILEDLQTKKKIRKIITIDWTEATSNIEIITDKNFEQTPILLPSWIDWVILDTNKKAELILPVADCAPIIAYHKTWEICGSFHAGYKWVAWEKASDLGIITTMVENLLKVANTNTLDDFDFYIWPMIWRKFELPKEYVEKMFWRIFKEYNLNPKNYFLKHDNDDTKIYLHLKKIIRDILKKRWKNIKLQWVLWDWSYFDNSKTDDWNSEYPSHRLYTKFQENKKRIEKLYEDLNDFTLYLNSISTEKSVFSIKDEIKKISKRIKSKKFEHYRKDYRLATILTN